MKKKLLVIVLVCSCFGFSYRQTAKKITESDYFEFINSITDSWSKELNPAKLKAMSNKPAFDEFCGDTLEIYQDKSFGKRDIAYFRKQVSAMQGYKWPKAKLASYRIVTQDEIDTITNSSKDGWKDFSKKYGSVYYVYSVPVFTFDKKRCIIAAGEVCGASCGKGNVILYTKEGNTWKKTKEYHAWKI